MELETYIPLRINELCKKQNISKYRLSQKTDISQSVIANILSGKNLPSLVTLEKICVAFNITLSQFFTTKNVMINLTDEQTELLNLWALLNSEEKNFIITCIQSIQKKK